MTTAPLIRTPDQRLRVFISSTLKELAAEREAARRAIRALHLSPVMFEMGARPHEARDLYRAYLDQSHVFVGIYGEQYGWVAPGAQISGLEEEYRLSTDIPKLIYIRSHAPERDPRLSDMLRAIRDRDGISYKYFRSAEELEELIGSDLSLLLSERFEMSGSLADGKAHPDRRLPAPATPLIGRDALLAGAMRTLEEEGVRLLVLTGPGGSGKTRLALEIAWQLADRDAHFVELAALVDHERVPDTVASELGIREVGGRSIEGAIREFYRDRRALLVLDNFEQVSPAARWVATLLADAPFLSVVVTSRMPLRVRAEQELPVPPLEIPAPGRAGGVDAFGRIPAVRLFAERARAVNPAFRLSPENVEAVAEISRRLDGLPLAIELAAARIRLLSPQAMLKRLTPRLPMLVGHGQDRPERQRTMESAIQWSYELLEEPEADLFRRLSVFAGGFSLDAAGAVCGLSCSPGGPDLDRLEALVSKSLLRVSGGADGDARFSMLETIREFALGQLQTRGESGQTLRSHAGFFADLAERAEPYLTSGQREEWLRELETNLDNLRAVLRRSLDGDIEPSFGIRIAGSLGWFWHLRGHLSEGRAWASAYLDQTSTELNPESRARLLFPAGGLAWSQGDYDTGNRLLEECAGLFRRTGSKGRHAHAQLILAGGLANRGELDRARALCEEAVRLMTEAGDDWGIAYAGGWLADVLFALTREADRSLRIYQESLDRYARLGDPWGTALALNFSGIAATEQGEFANAKRLFTESLALLRPIDDQWLMASCLSGYAHAMGLAGETRAAETLLGESAALWREMKNTSGLQLCVAEYARLAGRTGDAERAGVLFGAAPVPLRAVGFLFVRADVEAYRRDLAPVRESAGPERWERYVRTGEAMDLTVAVAYAAGTQEEGRE